MALAQPDNVTDFPQVRRMNNAPVLTVDPQLAVEVGVDGALFMGQLAYWIKRSGKERDGQQWVYNTINAWLEQFPFWKKSHLHRVIADLEAKGYIRSTSAYNASKIDRTKWYAIVERDAETTSDDDSVRTISHIPEMHIANPGNASSISRKWDAPIPETTTEITTEKENTPPLPPKPQPVASVDAPPDQDDLRFERFWKSYPSKTGKGDARKAWSRVRPKPDDDRTNELIASVECQKLSDRWQRGIIPNPSTWLNQGRWDDELTVNMAGHATPPNNGPALRTKNGGYTPEGLAQLARELEARGE